MLEYSIEVPPCYILRCHNAWAFVWVRVCMYAGAYLSESFAFTSTSFSRSRQPAGPAACPSHNRRCSSFVSFSRARPNAFQFKVRSYCKCAYLCSAPSSIFNGHPRRSRSYTTLLLQLLISSARWINRLVGQNIWSSRVCFACDPDCGLDWLWHWISWPQSPQLWWSSQNNCICGLCCWTLLNNLSTP